MNFKGGVLMIRLIVCLLLAFITWKISEYFGGSFIVAFLGGAITMAFSMIFIDGE